MSDGRREKWRLIAELDRWLQWPMIALAILWLGIVIVELTLGESRLLETLGTAIWVIFIAEFALRFTLAPEKGRFLKRNWLTAISLVVPAFRMLRAFSALRAARGLRAIRLVRIVGTANRSMRALRSSLRRRKFGYVLGLTLAVTLLGAAGMWSFENGSDGQGLQSFAHALWWTAMLMTTIGSDYWPVTTEGRLLALLLSAYALAVLGYVTATLASFFVGRDAEEPSGPIAGERELRALRQELRALREELAAGRAPQG